MKPLLFLLLSPLFFCTCASNPPKLWVREIEGIVESRRVLPIEPRAATALSQGGGGGSQSQAAVSATGYLLGGLWDVSRANERGRRTRFEIRTAEGLKTYIGNEFQSYQAGDSVVVRLNGSGVPVEILAPRAR